MRLRSVVILATLALTATAEARAADPRDEDIFGPASEAAAPSPAPTAPPDDPGRPSEDDLFGGDEPAPGDAPVPPATTAPASRDDALLGGESTPGLSAGSLRRLEEDILAIGGQLYMRFNYAIQQGNDIEDNTLSSPGLLDVYFDARPNDDVRAFARGRVSYDPTLDPDHPPFGGLVSAGDNPDVLLDQLWLKMAIADTVFLTIGKQPIKWGASRIWNPTDVINRTRRDPLAFVDLRTGVSAIKLHVPIESLGWNFYAIGMIDEAYGLDRVGAAARAEIVFSTVELALSGAYQRSRAPRFGFDISAGVWDFDLYAEVGLALGTDQPTYEGAFDPEKGTLPTAKEHGRDELVPQASVGIEYGVNITDEDVMYIGAEYFYNHLGYDTKGLYPYLLSENALEFFYVGQHYAALFVLLPGPGTWDDTNWTVSGLANLSDMSFVARLNFSVTVLTYVTLEAYVAGHFGARGGEFRFAIDAFQVPAIPGVEGLEEGIDFPGYQPQMIDLGLNLRVAI